MYAGGYTLAAGTEDGSVDVWLLKQDMSVREHFDLRGHRAAVSRVQFAPSPHLDLLYSAGSDGLVFEWTYLRETSRRRPWRSLRGTGRPVTTMALDGSASTLAIGDDRGTITKLDLAQGRACVALTKYYPWDGFALVGNGSRVAALESESDKGPSRLSLFDAGSGSRIGSLEVQGTRLYTVVAEPGSTRLAVHAGPYGAPQVLVWDTATDARTTIPCELLRGAHPTVRIGAPRMAWRPGSGQLGVRTAAGVFLFDGSPWAVVWSDVSIANLPKDDAEFLGVAAPLAFSPDGRNVYTSAPKGELVRIAIAESVTKTRKLEWSSGGGIAWLCISPDGRHLALGNCSAREVKILKADTLDDVAELWTEDGAAIRGTFDPTSRLLALGNNSHASLWSVASWRVLRRFPGSAVTLSFDAAGTSLLCLASQAIMSRPLFPHPLDAKAMR